MDELLVQSRQCILYQAQQNAIMVKATRFQNIVALYRVLGADFRSIIFYGFSTRECFPLGKRR
ncbi:hypothetical protein GKA01_26610 [Gluconobacter kanchanaburiensis NBRC 103587]|uniref:Uncharacterized protein n=1 Tax=Gluconobacter kanchanaburiensis NBRC 103587 TaxID=1307948 RepID=A0A511BAX7_9PROT|nr:hypothetical protein AA103587_2425 [Gluconobacter kanchanaburiensis NBRC 103587]GEK97464.1 hypothetical protein GKA01_26610 [Gluconobacter kanchanaburiensis NBRC 103587]